MMNGNISTYLPEKGYGFISGNDGKDYFFHQNDFEDQSQVCNIADESLVAFDQVARPKGKYKAIKISLQNPEEILTYIEPEEFLLSRTNSINGWEIIENAPWSVHGSSSESPDDARENLVENAKKVYANSAVELQYFKTTGSDGNYCFTIHNFKARLTHVARKNANGYIRITHRHTITERAEQIMDYFEDKIKEGDRKMLIFRILVATLMSLAALVTYFLYNALVAIAVISVTIAFLAFFSSNEYDHWLEPTFIEPE